MGKGDKKTKKGKINAGSYGILRKRKSATAIVVTKPKAKKVVEKTEDTETKPKKTAAKKPAVKKAAVKKPAATKKTAVKK